MDKSTIPFGMLFEEQNSSAPSEAIPRPEYDLETAISFIVDSDGNRVPFVIWAWSVLGGTKTGSTTKAGDDQEDSDVLPEVRPIISGTKTMTKQDGEDTDDD